MKGAPVPGRSWGGLQNGIRVQPAMLIIGDDIVSEILAMPDILLVLEVAAPQCPTM